MIVRNKIVIELFVKKHARARLPMSHWVQKVHAAQWQCFTDVRMTFSTASYRKPWVIFNVSGNHYRILAEINYNAGLVRIARIGTHSEYNMWQL